MMTIPTAPLPVVEETGNKSNRVNNIRVSNRVSNRVGR